MTLLVDPRAMGHVDLDPVGAVIELRACGFSSFYWAVDDLYAFGHVEFRGVAFEVIATGGGDTAGSAEEARAGDGAFGDGFLDFDVAVAGAFGFEVAQGGETLIEGAAAGESGPCGAQGDAGFENVGVVAAFGGVFAPEEDVRVGLDESGEDGGVEKIDNVESGGRLGGGGRDFYDAVVVDEDELVFERGGGGAVDQNAGTDYGFGVLGSSGLRGCDERGAEEYWSEKF